MVKQALFFLVSLIAMPAYSMNNESEPLVKKATHIYVSNLIKNAPIIKIRIDDTTTVLHVKEQFERKKGVPVYQQSLHPFSRSWCSLWLIDNMGASLQDDQKIKEIMNTHSDRFLLTSTLEKLTN